MQGFNALSMRSGSAAAGSAMRRRFVVMAAAAAVAGCGTQPIADMPATLAESVVVAQDAARRRALYAHYVSLDADDPRRFGIRNELAFDLMNAIDMGYRMHQWTNGDARHRIGVINHLPSKAGGLVGPFLNPPLPAGFLSYLGASSLDLPKALLGEAYFEEKQWGRILVNIEAERHVWRTRIEHNLRRPDREYSYLSAEMDLRHFWAAAIPSMALARLDTDATGRPPATTAGGAGASPFDGRGLAKARTARREVVP